MKSQANMPFLPELKCAMMHLCRAFVHPSTIEALLEDPMRLLAQIESNYAHLLLFLDLATSLRNDELQAQYDSNQTGPSKRSLHFPPSHDDQGLAIFWMCAAVVIRELEKHRAVGKGSSECEWGTTWVCYHPSAGLSVWRAVIQTHTTRNPTCSVFLSVGWQTWNLDESSCDKVKPRVETAFERVFQSDESISGKIWPAPPTAALPLDQQALFLKVYALLSSLQSSEGFALASRHSMSPKSLTCQSISQVEAKGDTQNASTAVVSGPNTQLSRRMSSVTAPEEPDTPNTVEQAVFRIVGMGFTPKDARQALSKTDSGTCLRVDAAIQLLLDQAQDA